MVSTSTVIFQYFKCHSFEASDGEIHSYLFKDYSLSCEDERYRQHILLAVVMILVYPVGIPALYFISCWRWRHILGDEQLLHQERDGGNHHIGHLLFLVKR